MKYISFLSSDTSLLALEVIIFTTSKFQSKSEVMKIFTEPVAKTIIISGGALFIAVPLAFFWHDFDNVSLSATVNDGKFSNYGSLLSGLIGTFWSLAGVILFYVALTEQRKDMVTNSKALELQTIALTQQIKEFELQTKELEETRKVYIEQSKTQSLQRFESTFFQMLSLHHNLVDSMFLREYKREGRDCFKTFNTLLEKELQHQSNSSNEEILSGYVNVFVANQEVLGHYFRNLYHILKFINNSVTIDKKFYVGLIRAQLSSYELSLLFYNGLSKFGRDKLKPLIEQFSLLKNLNLEVIRGGNPMRKAYKPIAYGQKNFGFLNKYDVTLQDLDK